MRAIHVLGIMGMACLPVAASEGPAAWRAHLAAMDEALERQDLVAAERAWREAQLAAQGSWLWTGLVEVADGGVRLAQASSEGRALLPQARSLYLTALFRARQQRSVEGMLRTSARRDPLECHRRFRETARCSRSNVLGVDRPLPNFPPPPPDALN